MLLSFHSVFLYLSYFVRSGFFEPGFLVTLSVISKPRILSIIELYIVYKVVLATYIKVLFSSDT